MDASLFFGEDVALGGLEGTSESQEQFGDGGEPSDEENLLSLARFKASLSVIATVACPNGYMEAFSNRFMFRCFFNDNKVRYFDYH